MMPALTIALGLAAAIVLVIALQRWRRYMSSVEFQRAAQTFPLERTLATKFLAAANATGKPRGLRWINCELDGEPLFATDRSTGEIYGLSGATIGFEAIPGGDMEDVEAVSDIRYVTAVFVYRGGEWQTDGRAIFNLEPAQAVERLSETTPVIGPQR